MSIAYSSVKAKSFVMAMLYMNCPLLIADLETWVRPDGERYAAYRSTEMAR